MKTQTIAVSFRKLNGDIETLVGEADIHYDEQIYIEDPNYREITAQIWAQGLIHKLETCKDLGWDVEAIATENDLGYGRVKDWFNVDDDTGTYSQVGLYRFRSIYPYDGGATRIVASDGIVARLF
jgi:hypothetical protein